MASSSVKNPNQTTTHKLEPLHPPQHRHHQIQNQFHHQQLHDHNQISFGMMQSSSSHSVPGSYNMRNKDSGVYDLGELDQALYLYLNGQTDPSNVQDQKQNSTSGMRPPTLNIFPSQPMHVEPSSSNSKASMELLSPQTSGSKRTTNPSMELTNPQKELASVSAIKRERNHGKGPTSSSEHEGPKTPDPKTLRRLAQNREAARKSRLRKKAYIQQLESSRIRLNQMEQELQHARNQGMFFGGGAILGGEQDLPISMNTISSEAAMFDVEYARWLEEHHRLVWELRAAVQEHIHENDLRMFVEKFLAQYDQVMNLKSLIAKADVFHLVSGMWLTPTERCFMWIGGFKPSELIKVIVSQIEPLTEQQIMGIYGLQQSTQEGEEALSQGLEVLYQSISNNITSHSLSYPPNMTNYMEQMAMAVNKFSTLESFVTQADRLRLQTIHRLHQILTIRQAARCFVAMAEYFHRMRALSSLWLARPRQE